ncbi:histidine kinase [Fusarium sp. NRRL 25303]|nr:histidine kinase [Fusarium sp. NRRL 25303]
MSSMLWPPGEVVRERETFRYDPALIINAVPNSPTNLIPSDELSASSDAILTAFCQLAALRLNTTRALISLFDRSNQYVVAEATQDLRLLPNASLTQNDPGLWLCGTRFPRSFGVCERVLVAPVNEQLSCNPSVNSNPNIPVTVISDLRADDLLCHRPYCHSWPNNRFYAGVPLKTTKGINIGVLCVFDSQPRSGLDEPANNILRDLAQAIMTHLEERRVTERYRQADRVTRGIQRFFHGRASQADMRDDQLLATEPRLHTPGADSSAQSHHSTDNRHREDRLKSTCASAADIMRDALEVDGLMLLDASHSRRSTQNKESIQAQDNKQTLHGGDNALCPVLSSSVAAEAKCDGNSYFGHSTLSVAVIKKLLRYYPRGTIWNFETGQDDSSEVHSDDSSVEAADESPVISQSGKTSPVSSVESTCSPGQLRRRQELRKEVLKMLPDAKSVALFPVWDAQKQRWFAGGFAYSVKPSRVFSPKRELSYLRAFGTVLMAEVSSMREREIERSKLGVLDSISHELRSPLHGIILGAGLLRGTRLDYSQEEALLSVEACSRTLLDAIDQILDWTKINRFTSSLTKDTNYTYSDVDSRTLRSSRENSVEASMMNIASRVDLPNLVEEVVESIHAGHEFQKLSLGQKSDLCNRRVRVSIHFSPSPAWKFHVQAGAIRRIIMNILGNSLKFTTSGFIHVQVEQLDMPCPPAGSDVRLVRLAITDTGCGIDKDFLSHEIFTPFSQQDNMDAGTGLGLSVVRRIVQAMEGTVDVQSTSGVGTTVQVDLPLKCAEAPELATTDDVHKTWDSELTDAHLERLEGLKVSLVGFHDCLDKGSVLCNVPSQKEIISSTCQQWLGLDLVDSMDDQSISPDIVLCDDRSFDNATSAMTNNSSTPLIVVCQNAVMARKRTVANNLDRTLSAQNIFFTHQPRQGNERSVALGQNPPTPPAVNGENSNVFSQDLSLYPPTPNWYLPQQLPRSPLATPSEKPDPMCAEPSTSERLFLLVDDNPINLKMLVVIMKKLNLPYCTATDGQQAVVKYRENPKGFRCVFMDISMPVMNGFEATRAIRKIETGAAAPRCAVFALTGLASQEAQQEAILSGIDLFLTKPIKLAEIRQILETKHLIDV